MKTDAVVTGDEAVVTVLRLAAGQGLDALLHALGLVLAGWGLLAVAVGAWAAAVSRG